MYIVHQTPTTATTGQQPYIRHLPHPKQGSNCTLEPSTGTTEKQPYIRHLPQLQQSRNLTEDTYHNLIRLATTHSTPTTPSTEQQPYIKHITQPQQGSNLLLNTYHNLNRAAILHQLLFVNNFSQVRFVNKQRQTIWNSHIEYYTPMKTFFERE